MEWSVGPWACAAEARRSSATLSSGMSSDENALVPEVDMAAITDHFDDLTGQPLPGLVGHRGETDRAPAGDHASDDWWSVGRVGCCALERYRRWRSRAEPEPLPRGNLADALVRTVVVVAVNPVVELRPSISEVVEHLAGQELLAQRPMPPLDLADRRRRPRCRLAVLDAFSRQIRSNSTSPTTGRCSRVGSGPAPVRCCSAVGVHGR